VLERERQRQRQRQREREREKERERHRQGESYEGVIIIVSTTPHGCRTRNPSRVAAKVAGSIGCADRIR
jgi:hypothetical protein